MNSLSGKVSDDRRPVLHNRGIIRRVYRWFVSLMSRKVLRPPSTVERKGVDNASLVANGSVKELGLRVVNHLANYSLPFPPFPSFLLTPRIERYIYIRREEDHQTRYPVSTSQFLQNFTKKNLSIFRIESSFFLSFQKRSMTECEEKRTYCFI